jgi:hypothetical protein
VPISCRSHVPPLAAFALAIVTAAAGCQTPQTNAVPPPGTGMIGQPAQYGGWATPPQGAAYPPVSSQPPLPGPATQWQGMAPTAPANTWSWSQPAAQPPGLQAPSLQQYGNQMQQYGNQLQGQAQQFQRDMTSQAQQYANQLQAQPQQYANDLQQQLANQQQQLTNQAQASVNQLQQGVANQWQQTNDQMQAQAQQALNSAQQQTQQFFNQAQQQVTAQMPTYPYQQPYQQPYPPQPVTANTSWNPFATSATSLPPARSTPLQPVPRY